MDKRGKWFIITDEIKGHHLDHRYKPGDMIALTYATGKTLASQTRRIKRTHVKRATSLKSGRHHALGTLPPNANARILIKPLDIWGERKKHWKDSLGSSGGSCGKNCIGMDYHCQYEFNIFEHFNENFTFAQWKRNELSHIILVLGDEQFPIGDVDKNPYLKISWNEELLQIDLLPTEEKKVISFGIKLIPLSETTFNGIKLTHLSGDNQNRCIDITLDIAHGENWPVSVDSVDFEWWKQDANRIGESKTYRQNFSVAMESLVEERFN